MMIPIAAITRRKNIRREIRFKMPPKSEIEWNEGLILKNPIKMIVSPLNTNPAKSVDITDEALFSGCENTCSNSDNY